MRRPQVWQMVKLMLTSRRCAGGGYGKTVIRTRLKRRTFNKLRHART
jgi:hypothetical protein